MRAALIFLQLLVLVTATETFGTSRPRVDQAPKWTIMIYMNGQSDNTLEQTALCNLSQILSVKLSGSVQIFIQLGFPGIDDNGTSTAKPSDPCSSRRAAPYWHGTRRLLIAPGIPGGYSFQQRPKNSDMRSPDALTEFIHWVRQQPGFSKTHRILLLRDHGRSGPYLLRPSHLTSNLDHTKGHSATVESSSDTRTEEKILDGDLFFNWQIHKAVADGLQGDHVDVIVLDACYKSMLETAYIMSDVGDQLVASESSVLSYRWDYRDWISSVSSAIPADSQSMAKLLVDSYKNINENRIGDDIDVAAVNIHDLQRPLELLDNLSMLLSKQQLLWPMVNRARAQAKAYDRYNIDLQHFEALLGQEVNDTDILTMISKLEEAQQKVIYPFATQSTKNKYGSTGISIYFPQCKDDFESDQSHLLYDPMSAGAIPFAREHQWSRFLVPYVLSGTATCQKPEPNPVALRNDSANDM